jgi:hypothetical protein
MMHTFIPIHKVMHGFGIILAIMHTGLEALKGLKKSIKSMQEVCKNFMTTL